MTVFFKYKILSVLFLVISYADPKFSNPLLIQQKQFLNLFYGARHDLRIKLAHQKVAEVFGNKSQDRKSVLICDGMGC